MHWSVARKLAIGFGGIMALVAVMAAIAFVNMQSLVGHQNRMVFREAVMRNGYETLALVNFANSTLRGYTISIKDPAEAARIKENLFKNWKQLQELSTKLNEQVPNLENNEQKKLVQALVEDAVGYEADQRETVRLAESGDKGLQQVWGSIAKASFTVANKLRNDVRQLVDSINKEALEQDVVAAAAARRSIWIILVASGFVLAIGVALVMFLRRSIAVPLREAAGKISQAEHESDLTVRVVSGSQDEVGEICTAFNSFVQRLHRAVAQAAGTAEQVASASEEIAAAAGQAAAGADSEQQYASRAATAMHGNDSHSKPGGRPFQHRRGNSTSGGGGRQEWWQGGGSLAGEYALHCQYCG